MNKAVLRNLYGHWYFRIPLKLAFTLCFTKFCYDSYDYLAIGCTFGMPRCINIYNGQNPINPPIPQPYPYANSYEHLQNIKAYQQYRGTIFKGVTQNKHYIKHILNDHPCRQNPDAIDEFVEYGNIYRVKEYINYVFVNKLKQEGVEIPEGINQKIRELEQYRLDYLKPIIPQL